MIPRPPVPIRPAPSAAGFAVLALLAAGCAGTPELTGAAAARSRGATVIEDPPSPSPGGGSEGAAPAPPSNPWFDDARVLGYVNGEAISLREVRHELGRAYDAILDRPELLAEAVNAKLRELIVRRIVTAEMTRLGFQVPDELFERRVEALKREAAERGDTLEQYLRDIDITRREWEENEREKILHQNAILYFIGEFSSSQYSEDHFRPTVDTFVSPGEIRAYGERHPEVAAVPERATVRVIDLRVQDHQGPGVSAEEAWAACGRAVDAVEARLDGGEDFGDVAREVSRGLNASGGGLVEDADLRGLRREYRDWAFAPGRRTGDRSERIRLPTGYLLLYMEEYRPAHRSSIEEWGPEVRRRLESDKMAIAVNEVEIDLLERAAISPPELKDLLVRERRANIRRIRESMR